MDDCYVCMKIVTNSGFVVIVHLVFDKQQSEAAIQLICFGGKRLLMFVYAFLFR